MDEQDAILILETMCIGKWSAYSEAVEFVKKAMQDLKHEKILTRALKLELEQARRERDAAIRDVLNFTSCACFCCKKQPEKFLADGAMDDYCRTCLDNKRCNWIWRGVQEGKENA